MTVNFKRRCCKMLWTICDHVHLNLGGWSKNPIGDKISLFLETFDLNKMYDGKNAIATRKYDTLLTFQMKLKDIDDSEDL